MEISDTEIGVMFVIFGIAVGIGGAGTNSFVIGTMYGVGAIIGFIAAKYIVEKVDNARKNQYEGKDAGQRLRR